MCASAQIAGNIVPIGVIRLLHSVSSAALAGRKSSPDKPGLKYSKVNNVVLPLSHVVPVQCRNLDIYPIMLRVRDSSNPGMILCAWVSFWNTTTEEGQL